MGGFILDGERNIDEKERIVRIEGKAYFDIRRDTDRPFIIYTNEAKVEVLGTSFQVDASNPEVTEVIVESGVVAFSQNPDNYLGRTTSIKLTKGEKGIIKPDAKGIIKQKNRDANYLAWANQKLVFKGTKLSEVGDLIEEVYGYQVNFSNKDIPNCKLTATYDKKSPKEVIKLISNTFGFTYEMTNDKVITFSGKACQ